MDFPYGNGATHVEARGSSADGLLTFDVSWPTAVGVLDARFTVPDGTARLADLVPLARQMSTRLGCLMRTDGASRGQPVSCHKGCSVCCEYLVPLSVPEALRLAAEINMLPPRLVACLRQRFLAAGARLMGCWRTLFGTGAQPEVLSSDRSFALLSEAYARLRMPCPFLHEKLCANYLHRPVACREHMTSQDPDRCAQSGGARPAPAPLSLLEALVRVTCELEGRPPEIVPLPYVLSWCDRHAQRAQQSWPSGELFQRFVDEVGRLCLAGAERDMHAPRARAPGGPPADHRIARPPAGP